MHVMLGEHMIMGEGEAMFWQSISKFFSSHFDVSFLKESTMQRLRGAYVCFKAIGSTSCLLHRIPFQCGQQGIWHGPLARSLTDPIDHLRKEILGD